MSENESARDTDAIEALRAWDEAQPGYDVEAGAARFRASLGLPPTPPPASAPPGLGAGTLVAAAAAVVAVVAGWLWSARPGVESRARAWSVAAGPIEARNAPAEEPEHDAAPPADLQAALPPEPLAEEAEPAPPRPRPRARRAKDPSPPPPAAETPSELALLREMRAALSRAPRRALKVGERLDALYPDGVLLEERAALRVLALDGAGRSDKAHAAAAAFLRDHPGSAFATRIRALSTEEPDIAGEGPTPRPQESQ